MCLRGLLHKPLRHCKKLLSSYYISNSYAFYVSVFPAGEKFAFENSTATIVWGENPSITEIKSSAFQNYKGTSLSVPDTIVSIKDNAFNGCENIVSFSIPDGITLIPEFCFKNCYSLTEVSVPSTITEIGASAFENCRNLESISLPEGLLSIDSGVFRGCSSLSSVVIPVKEDGIE